MIKIKGSKIKRKKGWSKEARAKGNGVEYGTVYMLRKEGYWAKRLKSKEQIGEMHCVDGYYWNPVTQTFGYFQAKYRQKYLRKPEREELWNLGEKYRCEILFTYREEHKRGIRREILHHQPI